MAQTKTPRTRGRSIIWQKWGCKRVAGVAAALLSDSFPHHPLVWADNTAGSPEDFLEVPKAHKNPPLPSLLRGTSLSLPFPPSPTCSYCFPCCLGAGEASKPHLPLQLGYEGAGLSWDSQSSRDGEGVGSSTLPTHPGWEWLWEGGFSTLPIVSDAVNIPT